MKPFNIEFSKNNRIYNVRISRINTSDEFEAFITGVNFDHRVILVKTSGRWFEHSHLPFLGDESVSYIGSEIDKRVKFDI